MGKAFELGGKYDDNFIISRSRGQSFNVEKNLKIENEDRYNHREFPLNLTDVFTLVTPNLYNRQTNKII